MLLWQNSLVSAVFQTLTIKAAFFSAELKQLFMRLFGRPEDKNAGVETVWPTRIRSCRQLFPLEKFIYVGQHLQTTKHNRT